MRLDPRTAMDGLVLTLVAVKVLSLVAWLGWWQGSEGGYPAAGLELTAEIP